MKGTSAALCLALLAAPARAHELGHGDGAHNWTLSPGIVLPLLVTLLLFAVGWLRLRARAGAGKPQLDRRAVLFGTGWAVLAGAVVSPLHRLGERSFAAHMLEHELLMLVAAPLLVLARPLTIFLWAFSANQRKCLARLATSRPVTGVWQAIASPVAATVLQAAVLWLWHAPALFDRALASEAWHATQHAAFLIAGLLFWTAMLSPRTLPGVAVLCLFATSVVSGALGALMAFAASPWYPRYAALGLAPFGLTPTQDQQLAGLLMWVPGGMVHAAAALVLLHRMLRPDKAVVHAG